MTLQEELSEIIAQIYTKHPTGGAMHIVLDDGNTEDNHIDFCIRYAVTHYPEEDQRLFLKCADLLFKIKSPRLRYRRIRAALDKMLW